MPRLHTRNGFRVTAVASIVALASYGEPAFSQGQLALEEVIVTAQKREQNIQEIPLSVAAFTGAMVEQAGGTNITTINGIAPNIILQTEGLVPNVPMYSIRGMNHSDPDPNSDPKTSTIIDGVYVPFVAATMLDMFDIDRVEVLRGPQGTLFGKNNLAGTINVISSRPTGEFGGKVSVTAGENGLQHYKFKINTPSFGNDMLAAKLAGAYREYDGYVKNVTTGNDLNGQEVKSWRGAVKFSPAETFDSTLIVDYTDDETDGPGGHSLDPAIPEIAGDKYKAALNFDPYTDTKTTGYALDMNWDVGGGTLTAVLGYRDLEYFNRGDFDGTPYEGRPPRQALDVGRDFDGDTQSAELRFASSWNDWMDYVLGLYYQEDDWKQINDVKVFTTPVRVATYGKNEQEGKSYAAFAQGDIHLTEALTLTLGGRFTKDEKKYSLSSDSLANGVVTGSFVAKKDDDWDNFSPRAALQYDLGEDTMLYASVSEGYKGGGYNSRATLPELVGPYDEETVTAYEIGFKSDLMGGRLRLNAAAFFNKYEDLQAGVQRPGALRAESITTNVAEVEIKGLEVEMTVLPIDNLRIGVNLGLLDSEYTDFCDDTDGASAYFPSNCGGFEQEFRPGQWLIAEDQTHLDLANAPDTSASLLLDYDLPVAFGTIGLHGDLRYTDKYNTWGRSNDPGFYRDSVTLFNAHVSFTDCNERYKITVYGKNLTDEEVMSGAVATGANPITQFYQPPREAGIEGIYFF
jgi:iron complex outermembrane receptor protein